MSSFVCLGRVIAYNNSDWPALYRNLKRAQTQWGMIVWVLEKDGASVRARGLFYKTIAMAVLLYGCETWTVTDSMLTVLEGFHHKVARRLTGRVPRLVEGAWDYPPLADALGEAGLHSIGTYIHRRQTNVAIQIATRPIFNRCFQSSPLRGSPRTLRWWQQNHRPDPSYVPSEGSHTTLSSLDLLTATSLLVAESVLEGSSDTEAE